MKKLEAFIEPFDFDAVKAALVHQGVASIAVSSLRRYSATPFRKEVYRGAEVEIDWRDELKLELILIDQKVAPVVDVFQENAPTAKIALFDLADIAHCAAVDDVAKVRANLRLAS